MNEQALSKLISVIKQFGNITPVNGSDLSNLFYARCKFALEFLLFSLNLSDESYVCITSTGTPIVIAHHPFFEINVYFSNKYQGMNIKSIHFERVIDNCYVGTFQEFLEKPDEMLKAINTRLGIQKEYDDDFFKMSAMHTEDEDITRSMEEYYGYDSRSRFFT